MTSTTRSLLLIAMFLVLTGCVTAPTHKVHYSLLENPTPQRFERVVLLPVDVEVHEMSAGGVVEEVGDWSQQAGESVRQGFMLVREDEINVRAVDASKLTRKERKQLEQHLELFKVVAGNALWATNPMNTGWQFKNERFDYTLGEGLSFLERKYGVNAGLIVIGQDTVTTGGRKAMSFAAAVAGYSIQMDHEYLVAGLVEFESGNVLWLNQVAGQGSADLRDAESAKAFVEKLMQDYPGLEAYQSQQAAAKEPNDA